MINNLPYEPLKEIGQGLPVLLLDGLPGPRLRIEFAERLRHKYRFMVPRLPFVSQPVTPYRMNDLVTYVHNFTWFHKLGHPRLLALPGSGILALRLLRDHPGLFTRVVIADAPAESTDERLGSYRELRYVERPHPAGVARIGNSGTVMRVLGFNNVFEHETAVSGEERFTESQPPDVDSVHAPTNARLEFFTALLLRFFQ